MQIADEKHSVAALSSSFAIRAYSCVRPFPGIEDALQLEFFPHPLKFALSPAASYYNQLYGYNLSKGKIIAGTEIVTVEGGSELRDFIDLPWKIYAEYPGWIPP